MRYLYSIEWIYKYSIGEVYQKKKNNNNIQQYIQKYIGIVKSMCYIWRKYINKLKFSLAKLRIKRIPWIFICKYTNKKPFTVNRQPIY